MWDVARDMSALLRSMTCEAPFCIAGPCRSSMWDAARPMDTPAAPTAPASNSSEGDLQQEALLKVDPLRNKDT